MFRRLCGGVLAPVLLCCVCSCAGPAASGPAVASGQPPTVRDVVGRVVGTAPETVQTPCDLLSSADAAALRVDPATARRDTDLNCMWTDETGRRMLVVGVRLLGDADRAAFTDRVLTRDRYPRQEWQIAGRPALRVQPNTTECTMVVELPDWQVLNLNTFDNTGAADPRPCGDLERAGAAAIAALS